MQIETLRGKLTFKNKEELLGFYSLFFLEDRTEEISFPSDLVLLLKKRIIQPLKKVQVSLTFPDLPYSQDWSSSNYRLLIISKRTLFLAFEDPIFLRGLLRAKKLLDLEPRMKVWSADGTPRVLVTSPSVYYSEVRSN